MKILFAPSEGKTKDGETDLDIKQLTFTSHDRIELLKKYHEYIFSNPVENLSKLFGLKKEDDIIEAKVDIFAEPTTKAIQKYQGVAYDHLNYVSLTKEQKIFIDENLIIFSNLFGPLLAKDKIPYYRLKQAEKLDGFDLAKFYKTNFSDELDEFLKDELVIDLRAGYYEKYYAINREYITCKFIKNNKIASHWAKAYRGLVLRELSKYQPQNEDEFASINFEGLMIKEILKKGKKQEYIYEII